jgi:hypothetical protein
MSYSERILAELVQIANKNQTGLLEAAADYCIEHDLIETEFIDTLDSVVIQRLREDAVRERKVRRCVQKPSKTLF